MNATPMRWLTPTPESASQPSLRADTVDGEEFFARWRTRLAETATVCGRTRLHRCVRRSRRFIRPLSGRRLEVPAKVHWVCSR